MEQIKFYLKNYWWKLLVVALIIFVDLLTKHLIVRVDEMGNVTSSQTDIIPGVLVIYPTLNSGAGFSLLAGKTVFLIVSTFLFLAALFVFDLLFKRKSILFGIATALIFGGAVGNLVDRINFQKVRDFIYLEFIRFPVFNVADICLTVGVILLGVYVVFFAGKGKNGAITAETSYQNNNDESQAVPGDDISTFTQTNMSNVDANIIIDGNKVGSQQSDTKSHLEGRENAKDNS